jgi:hypothetical protein
MVQDDFAQKIERAFVDVVTNKAEQRNIGKMEFAARMWPWMNPKSASSQIPDQTTKGQQIFLSIYIRISDII